ncbi:MAG: hypothetical protein K2N05_06255 [Muribaculaceae bacterium]|nr:hypothetical protein [Muribaculaceae bacterium]
MPKILKIRDLTLRDGQQSLVGARMRKEIILPLLPLYRDAAFHIVEVWGSDVLATALKYLGEAPWERLKNCADELEGISILSALTQGVKPFGEMVAPNYILQALYKNAFKNGLNMMRLYDNDNNIERLREPVALINDLGGMADVAICFIPQRNEKAYEKHKKKGFFAMLFGSEEENPGDSEQYTDDYYVEKAKEAESLGAEMITLKDPYGLATPSRIYSLMPKLKQAVRIPVDYHTHCTHGYGLASTLMAIIKGVDVVDTNIWWFSGGSAAPPIELIHIFCHKLEIEVGANMEAVREIRKRLRSARLSLSEFDRYSDRLPNDFDEFYLDIPEVVDGLFDQAIQAASDNDEEALLGYCHALEKYFGFPVCDDYEEESDDVEKKETEKSVFSEKDEERLLLELLPDIADLYLDNLHNAENEKKDAPDLPES